MGRKKIQITKISDERTRQTTFSKRKVGLVKKAIELSVLCQCDVLLIGFGPQQIFTYSSADMDKLIEQYKAYDGVCEVFNNEDLDSLKPGKITTGCSVVQRKQGVSIPLTKKETPQSKPVSVHTTPMLPHPIASRPHANYNEQSNVNGLPVFPPLNNGPMNATGQVSNNQGISSILTRKRKSIPGGWMSGIGLNDFPGLGFQNQPIAPLRTPPGPGPTPSFSLAPQESRIMKNPLTSPNPQQHGIPPPDVHSVNPDEMKEHVGVNEPDFHFAKKPKVRHHKAPDEDMSSQLAEDQSKLGFYSRNSNMNNFGAPPMSFLMGDPLTSNSPEMNLDSEMHDTAFYRFQDPLPQMSKPAHSTLGDGLNWMNSNSTQVSNGPSFTLASGNFTGQPQQHL